MAKRERVLVTGAGGSVGRLVVRELLDAGYSVRATDLPEKAVNEAHEHLEVVAADLRDTAVLPRLTKGVSRVIHVAASMSGGQPWNALKLINVDATLNLFDAAQESGAITFVYLSSASVYQTQRRRVKETDPLEPLDPVARSKFAAERGLLRKKQTGASMRLVVLRPALMLGPYGTAFLSSLATAPPLFREMVGVAPKLFGGPRTAVVHALDVARAAVHLMEKGRDLSFYNVACDDWNTLADLFNLASQAYGLLVMPLWPLFFPPTEWVEKGHVVLARPEVAALFRLLTRGSWNKLKQRHQLTGELEPSFSPESMGYGLRDLTLETQRLKETGFELRYPDVKSTVWDVMHWYKTQKWIPS